MNIFKKFKYIYQNQIYQNEGRQSFSELILKNRAT